MTAGGAAPLDAIELSAADRDALERALAVVPLWREMARARDAVGLAEDILLHAGPAFDDPGEITRPIRTFWKSGSMGSDGPRPFRPGSMPPSAAGTPRHCRCQ